MNTIYRKIFLGITTILLIACSKDEQAENVQISVSADKNQVKVGENIQFRVQHNASAVTIFTGDEGHNYDASAYVLLDGKTEQEIQNNVHRITDPDIRPYRADFAQAQVGENPFLGGIFRVLNANSGDDLDIAEAMSDASINQNVLKVTSTNPDWWNEALRLNVNSKIGSDKKLILRMKFDKSVLEEPRTGVQKPNVETFPVVIRLAGIPEGETNVIFNDSSVWDIYWKPQTSYSDYTLDLIRHIAAWEQGTNKKMETLSYIQILFTANSGAGYIGDYYIQSASYGGVSYLPFSTGKSLSVNSNSGELIHNHTYTQAGTYKVVVVGTNKGFKNYSGKGYQEEKATGNSNEYNYSRTIATLEITVTP
ncbi:DUF5017 domain-containing protein [Capnocytophaga catalasegens]|uniref:DUF5017 domain-containing protein n=1 Tax=Capnocytophaga catalasegens TaxID=1004260 RepID=A0AAV5AWJ7_9FLAO|nr:DUF5017 domain-containing protein [Capnocytophaga catalasegens]GIZ15790.1 hypothetical protein RCZ03_17900 [Capnocytophaga catalasegens]GJM49802.1 hypothetical protein RCZ15_07770 [Capnocytophaga catalasegens]GJM52967.1 hypothetical protein RCZ16_12840 [Capnocytophaga catalasegens]